jgi:hypothetical protein
VLGSKQDLSLGWRIYPPMTKITYLWIWRFILIFSRDETLAPGIVLKTEASWRGTGGSHSWLPSW